MVRDAAMRRVGGGGVVIVRRLVIVGRQFVVREIGWFPVGAPFGADFYAVREAKCGLDADWDDSD